MELSSTVECVVGMRLIGALTKGVVYKRMSITSVMGEGKYLKKLYNVSAGDANLKRTFIYYVSRFCAYCVHFLISPRRKGLA